MWNNFSSFYCWLFISIPCIIRRKSARLNNTESCLLAVLIILLTYEYFLFLSKIVVMNNRKCTVSLRNFKHPWRLIYFILIIRSIRTLYICVDSHRYLFRQNTWNNRNRSMEGHEGN